LIRNRIPDVNGQLLLPDLTTGIYELREVGNNGIGNPFEGKLIVDKGLRPMPPLGAWCAVPYR
jgi:hypothetical protein